MNSVAGQWIGCIFSQYVRFSDRPFINSSSVVPPPPNSLREESISAQTMMLRLLQSCFSMLAADDKPTKFQEAAQAKTHDNTEVAEELRKHLFEGDLSPLLCDSLPATPLLKLHLFGMALGLFPAVVELFACVLHFPPLSILDCKLLVGRDQHSLHM